MSTIIEQFAQNAQTKTLREKTLTHPCYTADCGGHEYARVHLPVAPKCNVHCNYCVRKYDCANESRPGVTTEVLSPERAFEKYKLLKAKVQNLTVVGIAGPGDALANWEQTRRTIELIQTYDPDVTFCISTNGVNLPIYAGELLRLGVMHITITINAVDPEIGSKIYQYADFFGNRYTGLSAAAVILANQLSGLKIMADGGALVKVNTVALKGVNDDHIFNLTRKVKELGAHISNIMPHINVEGSLFEDLPQTTNKDIAVLRERCGVNIRQMKHCKGCRADAVGTLNDDKSLEYRDLLNMADTLRTETAVPVKRRFAVTSRTAELSLKTGNAIVDEHFGMANKLYIYETDGDTAELVDTREIPKYCGGVETCGDKDDVFEKLLEQIADCEGVITMRIGVMPQQKLIQRGKRVIITYDYAHAAVLAACRGAGVK